MSTKSRYELYCITVCILSLCFLVIPLGKASLFTYYYFSPQVGLNPIYRLDHESSPPFKLPAEFELEKNSVELAAERRKQYKNDLAQYKYSVLHIVRQNFMYSIVILFIFIGHLLFLRNASFKKNITSSKTYVRFAHSDAQKTRARFKGVRCTKI